MKTFLYFVVCLTPLHCFSQDELKDEKPKQFFIKGGVAISTVAQKKIDGRKVESIAGFVAGLGMNIALGTKGFSMHQEMLFIQKGDKESDSDQALTVQTYYIEVPVLVKYSFGAKKNIYLNAGPSLSAGIGGEFEYKSLNAAGQSITGKVKFGALPQSSPTKPEIYVDHVFDLGFQMGGGAIIKEMINLDFRYGMGLISTSSGGSFKNRVLQFSLGYVIQKKS